MCLVAPSALVEVSAIVVVVVVAAVVVVVVTVVVVVAAVVVAVVVEVITAAGTVGMVSTLRLQIAQIGYCLQTLHHTVSELFVYTCSLRLNE